MGRKHSFDVSGSQREELMAWKRSYSLKTSQRGCFSEVSPSCLRRRAGMSPPSGSLSSVRWGAPLTAPLLCPPVTQTPVQLKAHNPPSGAAL